MADLIDKDVAYKTLCKERDMQKDIFNTYHNIERRGIMQGFMYACEIIRKQNSVNRWIPVSEQMPDRFDTVLLAILSKNGYGEPAYYVTIGGLKNGKEFESYTGEMAEGEKVTHWMPLPEPPKEDENE